MLKANDEHCPKWKNAPLTAAYHPENMRAAHEQLETPRTTGKIVIRLTCLNDPITWVARVAETRRTLN